MYEVSEANEKAIDVLDRRFLICTLIASVAASCAPTSNRTALQSLTVVVPPQNVEILLERLRTFAKQERFTFTEDSWGSGLGKAYVFELRRQDIWIEGLNIAKDFDHDNVPMVNGVPSPPLSLDPGKFRVGFFGGDVKPTQVSVHTAVASLIVALQGVPGAIVAIDSK